MTWNHATLNYIQKTYEDIFLEFLNAAYYQGLLSDNANFLDIVQNDEDIENTIILELSVHALILSYIYEDLTRIKNAQDITLAQNDDLRIAGQIYLSPRPARASVTDIVFEADEPPETNIVIPLGTLATVNSSTEGGMFESIAEAELIAGTTEVTVPFQCTQEGPVGNVDANTITELVHDIDGIDSIYNPSPAVGGVNAEDWESYRNRLYRWNYILEKGTYDAVVDAITSVSAVDGYHIDRWWNGYGSCKIIISPPIQVVLDLVRGAVDRVKAIDEDITIVGVEYISIDTSVVANATLDEVLPVSQTTKDRIKTLIEYYLKVYIDGGTNADGSTQPPLGIGKDFVPFKAGAYLASQIPEIKDLSFSFPTAPVVIEAHQKAIAGTINATVV